MRAGNTLAAYRRDLEGVAGRIAADAEVVVLHLDAGTAPAAYRDPAGFFRRHYPSSGLRSLQGAR
jgi:predicted AAA+ superfamily ATPase